MDGSQNFWIVGALLPDGDMFDTFITRGCWKLGAEPSSLNLRRLAEMKQGDRIALKSLGGRTNRTLVIKAIGYIQDVDLEEKQVYVKWVRSDMDREVPVRGCLRAINGPFTLEDRTEWINEIFRL